MSALMKQMLQDNPAGLWPLNEASGTTAFDRSGNGRNGTYTGTCTPAARSSILGSAPDFAGGWVDLGDIAAWSPHAGASGLMTLECWALADTLGNAAMLIAKGNSGPSAYEYRVGSHTTGLVHGETSDTAGNVGNDIDSATGLVTTARLSHFVFTYDKAAALATVYLNGVQVGQRTSLSLTSSDASASLQIGHRADGGGTAWDGIIQYAAIYPTALPLARISAHYAAGLRAGVAAG